MQNSSLKTCPDVRVCVVKFCHIVLIILSVMKQVMIGRGSEQWWSQMPCTTSSSTSGHWEFIILYLSQLHFLCTPSYKLWKPRATVHIHVSIHVQGGRKTVHNDNWINIRTVVYIQSAKESLDTCMHTSEQNTNKSGHMARRYRWANDVNFTYFNEIQLWVANKY